MRKPTGVTPDSTAVTPDAPAAIRMPLLTREWLDLAFVHRAVQPAAVAGLMPRGTVPDTRDGLTFVGLVAFRMRRVGWLGLPGAPYFGSFPETDVRLWRRCPGPHRRPGRRPVLTGCPGPPRPPRPSLPSLPLGP